MLLIKITMINPEISIVLPCLNEEKALGLCIDEIETAIKNNNLDAEIIVVDNASTDSSPDIARKKKAILVSEPKRGYGNACLSGLKQAKGKYLLMADCDGSYDFNDIPLFLENLKENDLVIGNRFSHKELMPVLNRAGNWMIRRLLKLNGLNLEETCTGFIGAKRDKLLALNLQKPGMEFSSEVLVKAKKNNLKITEIPVNFRERLGEPKLNRFRDGFRHFKFLLFGI